MKAFYKVSVTKQSLGSAILHKEPPLAGEVVVKVSEVRSEGDHLLIVLDCSDAEHAENLLLPGVAELSQADAVALAPKYQPKQTMTELNRRTGKQEKITFPAADLKPFLAPDEPAPKPKRRTAKATKESPPQSEGE